MSNPLKNVEILQNLIKFTPTNEWNKLRQLSKFHYNILNKRFLSTIDSILFDVNISISNDASKLPIPKVFLNSYCPSIPNIYKKLYIPQLRFFDIGIRNMDHVIKIISQIAPFIEHLEIGYQKRQFTYCITNICYFYEFLKQFTNLKTFKMKIYTGLDLSTISKGKLADIFPLNCEINLETRHAMQMFERLFIAGAGNFPNFMCV